MCSRQPWVRCGNRPHRNSGRPPRAWPNALSHALVRRQPGTDWSRQTAPDRPQQGCDGSRGRDIAHRPESVVSMPAFINTLKRQPLSLCLQDQFGAFLKRVNNKRAEKTRRSALAERWGSSEMRDTSKTPDKIRQPVIRSDDGEAASGTGRAMLPVNVRGHEHRIPLRACGIRPSLMIAHPECPRRSSTLVPGACPKWKDLNRHRLFPREGRFGRWHFHGSCCRSSLV